MTDPGDGPGADANGTADARFAAVVRALHAEQGMQDTLQRAVDVAVELFPGCDHACVSLVHRSHRIDTPAFTDEAARRGDELQYRLQEGPCLDAIWTEDTVHSRDLTTEERWSTWGPLAADELGIRSMLCFQLFTSRDSLGALNLYGDRTSAFSEADVTMGYALAAHVSIALAGERDLSDANLAMAGKILIGQAEGILMERHALSGQQAWEALARIAVNEQISMETAAAQVIEDRADRRPR
ncbi:GAF and ANTAR domain-containing protein [Janibacter cremeus]|uniref:GAF and ANTAR domain-containing protein n=1 Tax=Janibacter cremeus TaxID=1285192 RepID=UPI0023F61E19|nr:GAF and ANTAR domain-containing protein [Janibacter cremeus]WEV76793.1 GAF and ANTAR domain-containing protein [Janibacter cremeus]